MINKNIEILKQRANEMLNGDYSRKIGPEELYTIICEWENSSKELEKYKKIAEWLTRYSIHKSIKIFGEEKCEYAIKNNDCPNFSEENCIQCIIEWARKEVEKNEKI